MFNLLIHGLSGVWEGPHPRVPNDRFLTYTHSALKDRFPDQSDGTLHALMELPALFAYEYGDDLPARAGWIRTIRRRQDSLELDIEFDNRFAPIPALEFRKLYDALDITHKFEPYNTHWAVKEVDLLAVLDAYAHAPPEGAPVDEAAAVARIKADAAKVADKSPAAVFIVHGRDDAAKNAVARWVERIGLEAIILSEQPNEGRAVIEKFEAEAARATFALVLLTPDDIGGLADGDARARARQNVVLELGYFIARLGPHRVAALVAGDVELPSDYAGVVYVPYDSHEGWKLQLARDFARAGLPFNPHRVFRVACRELRHPGVSRRTPRCDPAHNRSSDPAAARIAPLLGRV